ncbi:ACT domain-containing protein [Gautieria morchelliformis]|nr:ACT domain-containing protein [Gautieria morchelliformis]
MALSLQVLPRPFFLVKMNAGETLSESLVKLLASPLDDTQFLSITRTKDEVSIVSDFRIDGGSEPSTEWRCMRVAGPLSLNLTGIMNDLTTPLKAAQIPIFAISTWDTDFLLVPIERSEEAAAVMQQDGWDVQKV